MDYSTINLILFILAIFFYALRKLLIYFSVGDITYRKLSSKKIKVLIKEFSLSVNNQRLLFVNKDQVLFYLLRYQRDEFWGIKLTFGKNNQHEKKILSALNKSGSHLGKVFQNEYDFYNNIDVVQGFIDQFRIENKIRIKIIKENYLEKIIKK